MIFFFLQSSWQAKLYSKTASPPSIYVLFIFRRVLNWQIDHYWTIGNQNRHFVLRRTLRGISQSYNLNETYDGGDGKMSFHCAIVRVLLFVCITIKQQAKPWYVIAWSTRKEAKSSTFHRNDEISLILQLHQLHDEIKFYVPMLYFSWDLNNLQCLSSRFALVLKSCNQKSVILL